MHLAITQTKKSFFSSPLIISVLLVFASTTYSEEKRTTTDLLDQYISSKGPQSIIVFDASNIKQFWIENSVLSKKDSFEVLLNGTNTQSFKSVPLKIQLANVNETQDCRIEVISPQKDFSFSVLNSNSKVISSSSPENGFVDYSIASSLFHLEDTRELSFQVQFDSNSISELPISKIILSFSQNKGSSFVSSPGKIILTQDDVHLEDASFKSGAFEVFGKVSKVHSNKKILVTNNTLNSSVKIKNIGDNPTRIYLGYKLYSNTRKEIVNKNYPLENRVFKIVSAEKGKNQIVVNPCPDEKSKGIIALNAKEDLSDIPNFSVLKNRIDEIHPLENGQGEIILKTPIENDIPKGISIRIHGLDNGYIYTNVKVLKPGEEVVLSSSIKKDDSSLIYSPKAFPKGVYYVVPLIFSNSTEPDKENIISISEFSISY